MSAETLRRRYFAKLHEVAPRATDDQRREWQEKRIGKASTTEWTEADWKRALELLDSAPPGKKPAADRLPDIELEAMAEALRSDVEVLREALQMGPLVLGPKGRRTWYRLEESGLVSVWRERQPNGGQR